MPESSSRLDPTPSVIACRLGLCFRGVRYYLHGLGPGLMAGLSDNDPAGVATYAIVGATSGYRLLWLLVVATFMVQAVQVSAARLGGVAQQGLLQVARQRYGKGIATLVGVAILVANQATLIADVGAMGAAMQLITGLDWRLFVMPGSLAILIGTTVSNFRWLRNIFVVVGFLLVAYVVTAFLAHPDWSQALRGTFIPSLPQSTAELAAMVALLGTTVSPYLVVWQAQGEREARRTCGQFRLAVVDITTGYIGSNVVSYFIVVTTAATLYAHNESITTAADVANALRPLAGDQARLLFGIGLLVAAALAIPIFGITSGYVACELLDWPCGLSRPPAEAPGFYAVLSLAFLSGGAAALLGVDPIVALFESQVLNGLVMPIIIIVLGLLVNDATIMGTHRSTAYYNVWLVISFAIMATGGAVLLLRLM